MPMYVVTTCDPADPLDEVVRADYSTVVFTDKVRATAAAKDLASRTGKMTYVCRLDPIDLFKGKF